jgi:hypothetical protein
VNTNAGATYVTYSNDNGVSAGTPVQINLESVNPSSTGDTYQVGFSRGTADTAATTFSVKEPPFFNVTIDDTNSPVAQGDDMLVNATINNTGDVEDTQTIELEINGEGVVDNESVTLNGNDTPQTVTFVWETEPGDTGDYTATVSSDDTSDAQPVSVNPSAYYPTGNQVNAGQLNNFGNMQDDTSAVAGFRGSSPNAFDIDIETASVPAGDYTLEIDVSTVDLQGGSDGITVTATDESGSELGSTVLTNGDGGSTVTIDLGQISTSQDITVRYEGDRQNDELDVSYQRLVEN